MRQNFFEVIGMADVERVHSQMLAWLFASTVLGADQKSQILKELVEIDNDDPVIQIHTEQNHIDIVIETVSSIIVIENKIKITEHDGQLGRYLQDIELDPRKRRFVYLSLIPESVSNPNWITRTYKQLKATLLPHIFKSPANFDEHVFNEYVEAVGHLTDIVMEFDQDHTKFENVFKDGSFTKAKKASFARDYTNHKNFVRSNQLETVLQRHFLDKIRKSILPSSANSRIEETRGVALLHIVIAERSIGDGVFQWGVQFQGRTAKLTCAALDYAKSTCDQLPPEVSSSFRTCAESHNYQINPGRTKAYVSVSKKMDFEWADPFQNIAESYRRAYAELSEIGQHLAVRSGGEVPYPLKKA